MTLAFLKTGPVLLVQVAGALGAGSDLDGLRASVGRPRGPGVRAVLFDMARVTRLDAMGIGELLRIRCQVHTGGLVFGLLNVERRQRQLLDLAGLTGVLGVHNSVIAALSMTPVRPSMLTKSQAGARGLRRFSAPRDCLGAVRGTGPAMR